jgi:hypothetical protein
VHVEKRRDVPRLGTRLALQRCLERFNDSLRGDHRDEGREDLSRYVTDECRRDRRYLRPPFAKSINCYREETTMGMGRGVLLWLLGVPLPIIILLALFWHH